MSNEQSPCGPDCEVRGCDCDTSRPCFICETVTELVTVEETMPTGGRHVFRMCAPCVGVGSIDEYETAAGLEAASCP